MGDVFPHCPDLGVDVCLVQLDDVVRRRSALEPHFFDDVGFLALLEQLGEREGVARGRVDGVRDRGAHGPVVRVVGVDGRPVVFGRQCEDQVRLHAPDEGDDIAHEAVGWGHHAVGVAVEEDELRHAQLLARAALFIATQLPHLLMQILVGASRITVCDDCDDDPRSFAHEASERPARVHVRIIGVGVNAQHGIHSCTPY